MACSPTRADKQHRTRTENTHRRVVQVRLVGLADDAEKPLLPNACTTNRLSHRRGRNRSFSIFSMFCLFSPLPSGTVLFTSAARVGTASTPHILTRQMQRSEVLSIHRT